MRILITIFLFFLITDASGLTARSFQFGAAQYISEADLDNPERTIYLTDTWRFHPGDDPVYADPDFDDFLWDDVSTLLGANQLPFINWTGIGWFRLNLEVDASLVAKPLALDVVLQSGASEIYINGQLLYSFGTVSDDPQYEVPYQERKPRAIVFPHEGIYVIAVRYSNHASEAFMESGYNAGFRYLLADMNHHVSGAIEMTRNATLQQFLFTGVLLVFTMIHLLLYFFYPRHPQNLYFALFTASFGVLHFLNYQVYFSSSGRDILQLMELQFVFLLVTMIFFLLFSYSLFYRKLPRQFWFIMLVLIGIGVISASKSVYANHLFFQIVSLMFVIEIIRVLLVAMYREKNGAYFFSVGMTIFIFSQMYTALTNLKLIEPLELINPEYAGFGGVIVLLLTMSVSLSRGFAETSKNLENKLIEVRQLSQKTLEQERERKEREFERRLLEADNQRKTNELEEARQLQLSMLPAELPEIPGFELAVRMKTATEVGGDYYDFSQSEHGELTVAIGDATGHGVKAGIIVATAKSYFKTFANDRGNIDLLRVMSRGIRNMKLHKMYMTVSLLKLKGRNYKYVSAGMPPALIYRSGSGEIENLVSKGMPLGSVVDYPYKELEGRFGTGDVLLLMSDGLPEAFSTERRMLEMKPIEDCLVRHSSESPESILAAIEQVVADWTGERELDDDFTILLFKFMGSDQAASG